MIVTFAFVVFFFFCNFLSLGKVKLIFFSQCLARSVQMTLSQLFHLKKKKKNI